MLETPRQNSILSYAGLSKAALLALTKQAFAQADTNIPERFASFLPIFPFELIQNMSYHEPAIGACTSSLGFSRDPREYHHRLYEQLPDLYQADNYRRNFDYEDRYQGNGIFTMDQAWASHFPQFSAFMGEKLMIHLIGGGHQAVALPESLYPRGGGVLHAVERKMEVTARAEQFSKYVKTRVNNGDTYDAEAFGFDYLTLTGLNPVMLCQKELGRILQDLSIARSLQNSHSRPGLFTESAKRVESLCQYVPWRYACDTFETAGISRFTARLFQPCFAAHDFICDMWIPYQNLSSYVNKETMSVDMARLCEGYQIAAVYDPEIGGGRYPDALRVIVVRDREVLMMMGDVLNNPAYGDGMNPQGMISKQVFIPDSRELLRQRKLVLEETVLAVKNTLQSPEAYFRGVLQSILQEYKGRLVDAMYRREAALSQMMEGTRAYEKARISLDEKVHQAQMEIQNTSAQWKHGQVSGYDADIDYLHRKYWSRVDIHKGDSREPIPFSPDAQREQSIESGFAMRNTVQRLAYWDVCLPMEEAEQRQETAVIREPVQDKKKERAPKGPPEEDRETLKESAEEERDIPKGPPKEDEEREAAVPLESQETLKKPPKKPSRKPAAFSDLAQNLKTDSTAPKLAYIVRRDSEPEITLSNKDGKMASLFSKDPKERPSP